MYCSICCRCHRHRVVVVVVGSRYLLRCMSFDIQVFHLFLFIKYFSPFQQQQQQQQQLQ